MNHKTIDLPRKWRLETITEDNALGYRFLSPKASELPSGSHWVPRKFIRSLAECCGLAWVPNYVPVTVRDAAYKVIIEESNK